MAKNSYSKNWPKSYMPVSNVGSCNNDIYTRAHLRRNPPDTAVGAIRWNKGFSQQECANHVGCTITQWRSFELDGTGMPSRYSLKIQQLLGVEFIYQDGGITAVPADGLSVTRIGGVAPGFLLAKGVSLYSEDAIGRNLVSEGMKTLSKNQDSKTQDSKPQSAKEVVEDKPFSEVFAKDFNAREALVCYMWRKAGKTVGGKASGTSVTLFNEMKSEGIPFVNSKQVDNALRRAYVAKQIFLSRRGENAANPSTYTVNDLSRKMYERVMAGNVTETGKALYDRHWESDNVLEDSGITLVDEHGTEEIGVIATHDYDFPSLPLPMQVNLAETDFTVMKTQTATIQPAPTLLSMSETGPYCPLEGRIAASAGLNEPKPTSAAPAASSAYSLDKETFSLMMMEVISDGAESAKRQIQVEFLTKESWDLRNQVMALESEKAQLEVRLQGSLKSLEEVRAIPKVQAISSDNRRHLKHLHYLLGQMSDLHNARNFEGQTFRNLTTSIKDFQEDDFLTLVNIVGGILQEKG